jgi:hypothetical protein
VIIADNGVGSKLAAAVGYEWKGILSLAIYVAGLLLAFVSRSIAVALDTVQGNRAKKIMRR